MNLETLLLVLHFLGLALVVNRTWGRAEAYLLALAPITILTATQYTFSHWSQMRPNELGVVVLMLCLCLPLCARWFKASGGFSPPAEWLRAFNRKRLASADGLTTAGAKILRSAGRSGHILSEEDLKILLLKARVRQQEQPYAVPLRIGQMTGLAAIIALVVLLLMK